MSIQLHNPGAGIEKMVTLWAWENKGHDRGSEPRPLKLFDAVPRSTTGVRWYQRATKWLGQRLANRGRDRLHLGTAPAEKPAG
jgi:hypothetical protein